DQQNGPQAGGALTRWHAHLVICARGRQTIAGFGVQLRDRCNPATWRDTYTAQMLHVWVVPYPGGVFSDDLSTAATNAAAHAALAGAPRHRGHRRAGRRGGGGPHRREDPRESTEPLPGGGGAGAAHPPRGPRGGAPAGGARGARRTGLPGPGGDHGEGTRRL